MNVQQDLSAKALAPKAKADQKKWSKIPFEADIKKTIGAVEKRGIKVFLAENKKQALEKIAELIPKGSSVMTGSSTTLIEIGFTDFLKNKKHDWKNLQEEVFSEQDQVKRGNLRRHALVADYFLSSVNAIAMTGELVAADASGSRVGAFPFAAKNLILVSGANKITKDLPEALKRLEEYALKIESERAKIVYGSPSSIGKIVILANEMLEGRTKLILVKESLGY